MSQARSNVFKLRDVVNVKDPAFGAKGDGTTDDSDAFKAAVAAATAGAVLLVPRSSSYYKIDTSGGLTDAITINKRLTIQLDGDVKSTFGAIQANPPTIFYVTADDVSIIGQGSLIGDGTVNSVNTGTDSTIPSLVRCTGDNFTMTGVTVDTPYKVGIHLLDCYYAKITDNKFKGGPTAYSDTAYFAVRLYGGGKHIVSDNQFFPSDAGGMYVNCIFTNGANYCTFEGNIATKPYEKLVYLNGDYNVVQGNTVIGNTGTIPGTNTTGTVGTVFRADGTGNKITNNFSIYGGGAACRLGGKNEVSYNTFLNCGQGGIAVFASTSAFDYTTIRNNVVTCGDIAGVYVANGILVEASLGTNRYIDISGNTVKGFSKVDPIANIAAWTLNTTYPTVSTVKPTVANTFYYTCTTGGVSAGVEPTWPLVAGNTVVDGTVTWTCQATDTTTTAQIRMIAPGGGQLNDRSTISRNNVADGRIGISTTYADNCTIESNRILASVYDIKEINGTGNRYQWNTKDSDPTAAATIDGIAASSLNIGYSEGTWTPVISDGTDNATMAGVGSNAGKWTRIGRQVTLTANIASTALGSVNGAVRITGLPYAAAAGVGGNTVVSFGYAGGLNIPAGQVVTGIIQAGNNYIELYLWDAATGTTTLDATEWSDDGNGALSGSYFA